VVGGWWLVVGGWWLVVGGWWAEGGGWWIDDGGRGASLETGCACSRPEAAGHSRSLLLRVVRASQY